MLKKLIVVYNPRSSHHQAIEREVLAPVRKLQGWLVGKYEVKSESLEENARALAELLHDGDLVITAGVTAQRRWRRMELCCLKKMLR